jgi:hypothetical protein
MTFVGFANSLCLPRYLSPGTTLSDSLAGAMASSKAGWGLRHVRYQGIGPDWEAAKGTEADRRRPCRHGWL